jgi:membrane protein
MRHENRTPDPEIDLRDKYPGADADKPTEIPARGWWQVTKRAWAESKVDQVPLMSAGVAFFAFLSLFPALIAAVLIYGLVTTPEQVQAQVESISSIVPASARSLITDQLTSLASAPSKGLGIGLVIAVAAALWSASGGVGNLISAVNIAYDENETRGFVKRKGLSLLMTIGAILFFGVALAAVAVFPAVIAATDPPTVVRVLAQVARWVVLLIAVVVALAVLYRYAPDRDDPKMRWASVGAAVATVLWVLASVAFSLYASFGSYGKTYGSLAGVVVLLMWLWLTTYAVLLGAEINAEAEQQTVKDTTTGPEQPLGRRDAVKADSLPDERPTADQRS